jgi:hypothetical protein
MYAPVNIAVAGSGDPSLLLRSIVAKRRMKGAAVGNIIATIIVTHIKSINAKRLGVQAALIGMAWSTIDMDWESMPAPNKT